MFSTDFIERLGGHETWRSDWGEQQRLSRRIGSVRLLSYQMDIPEANRVYPARDVYQKWKRLVSEAEDSITVYSLFFNFSGFWSSL